MPVYADDDGDGNGGICRNICNATWSVRVCDDPPPLCIGWSTLHGIATVVFLVGSVAFGLAGLSPRVQLAPDRGLGVLKCSLCTSTVVCLVGFAITLSYTTTASAAAYRRQIGVLFGVAMAVVAVWLVGWGCLRRAGARLVLRDERKPLLVNEER